MGIGVKLFYAVSPVRTKTCKIARTAGDTQKRPACDPWRQLEQFGQELPLGVSQQEEARQPQQEPGLSCLSVFRHGGHAVAAPADDACSRAASTPVKRCQGGQNLDKPSTGTIHCGETAAGQCIVSAEAPWLWCSRKRTAYVGHSERFMDHSAVTGSDHVISASAGRAVPDGGSGI